MTKNLVIPPSPTVTFDLFNASFLNKSVHFYKTKNFFKKIITYWPWTGYKLFQMDNKIHNTWILAKKNKTKKKHELLNETFLSRMISSWVKCASSCGSTNSKLCLQMQKVLLHFEVGPTFLQRIRGSSDKKKPVVPRNRSSSISLKVWGTSRKQQQHLIFPCSTDG